MPRIAADSQACQAATGLETADSVLFVCSACGGVLLSTGQARRGIERCATIAALCIGRIMAPRNAMVSRFVALKIRAKQLVIGLVMEKQYPGQQKISSV